MLKDQGRRPRLRDSGVSLRGGKKRERFSLPQGRRVKKGLGRRAAALRPARGPLAPTGSSRPRRPGSCLCCKTWGCTSCSRERCPAFSSTQRVRSYTFTPPRAQGASYVPIPAIGSMRPPLGAERDPAKLGRGEAGSKGALEAGKSGACRHRRSELRLYPGKGAPTSRLSRQQPRSRRGFTETPAERRRGQRGSCTAPATAPLPGRPGRDCPNCRSRAAFSETPQAEEARSPPSSQASCRRRSHATFSGLFL